MVLKYRGRVIVRGERVDGGFGSGGVDGEVV